MVPAESTRMANANDGMPSPPTIPAATLLQPVLVGGLASSTARDHERHLASILLNPTESSNICSVELATKVSGHRPILSSILSITLDLNGFMTTVDCRVEDSIHDITLGKQWAETNSISGNFITQTLTTCGTEIRCSGGQLHTPNDIFPLKLKASVNRLHLRLGQKTGIKMMGRCRKSRTWDTPSARIKILLNSKRLRRMKPRFRSLSSAGSSKRKARDSDFSGVEPSKPSKAKKSGDATKKAAGKKKKQASGDGDYPGDDSDPDDDDGPGGDPVPKQGKKPRKRVRKLEQEQKIDVPTTEMDAQIGQLATILLQTQDPSLRNTRRMAGYMKSVKVRRIVKAVVPVENEVDLESYMQASPLPGRGVSPKSWSKLPSKNNWSFFFKDEGTEKVFKAEKKASLTVDFELLPKDTAPDVATQVHQELARLFNTWPWTFTSEGKDRPKMPGPLWVSRILTKIQSRRPEIQSPGLHGSMYSIKIKYIDSKTGVMATKSVRLQPSDATMASVQVPALPPMLLVEYGANAAPKAVTDYLGPTSLDASKASTTSQHTCQDALKWIAWKTQGLVASDARMDQLIGFYKAQIGIPNKDWYHGIYGNEGGLYYFSRYSKERTTKVSPSAPLAADFKGITRHQMQLTVHSLNASRCTPVAETIVQLFTDGEDPRRVWLESAKTADEVNLAIAEGVPPTSECDCPDHSASSELHPCEGCGTPTLCYKRVMDSRGRLVCAHYDYKDKNTSAAIRNPNETAIQNRLRVGLSANFRNECRTRGSNPDSQANQAILQKAIDDILKQLDPFSTTEYTDQYTGQSHDMGLDRGAVGKNPSRRRYVPWMLCADAAFPEGSSEFDGMKHSAGNLETTSVVCNMAKYIHLPGALHVIAEFLRFESTSPQDRSKLLQSLSNLTLARLKHRFIRKSSSEKIPARDRLHKAMMEMIRGEPVPGERGPWEAYSKRYVARPPPVYEETEGNNLWSDEVYERLQACAHSIANYFGVEPSRLDDNTIWFGDKDSNPEGLDRNGVFQLCRERLARMRLVCNKKWDTSDNEETLYAEIIFQSYATMTQKTDLVWLKQKYGDRLGLPLTTFINSPLKFSIAHRHHGFGMLTGWPTPMPHDVQERIENDKQNNMLIESWYINSAKLDIAEEYYDKIDQILRSCHVSAKRYRPDAPPPEDSGELFNGSFDEFEYEDDFVGEDFNADAFEGGKTGDGTGPAGGVAATDRDTDEWASVSQPAEDPEEEGSVDTGEDLHLDPDDSLHASLKRIRGWIATYEGVGQRFVEDPQVISYLFEAQKYADEGDVKRCERARAVVLEKLGLLAGSYGEAK